MGFGDDFYRSPESQENDKLTQAPTENPLVLEDYYRQHADPNDPEHFFALGAQSDASNATAHNRNPYDYVIGQDQNYVGNMSAQQVALGQQAQAGYQGLQNQAQGIGQGAASYANSQAGLANATALGAMGAANQGANQLQNTGLSYAGGIQNTAGQLSNQAAALGQQARSALGQSAPTLNYGQQNGALDASQTYARQLAGQQQGPSGAQAMLNQGTNESLANSLALARSGRGWGGSAAGMAQALNANAATMQNASNQAALLKAQETAQWNAQQANNLQAAAGIQQGAGSQFGAQTNYGAQVAQNQQQINNQQNQALNSLALTGQQAALGGQVNAANVGMQGVQAGVNAQLAGSQLGLQGIQTGANIANQGTQSQLAANQQAGAMLGAGSQAASQGSLNAFGFNQAQNQSDIAHENMITQDYGIRKGVDIANNQAAAQQQGAFIQAVGTGLGYAMASDERVKKNIRSADGVARQLALTEPYTYEYRDPRYGQGEQTGIMAQDLERTPAGRTAVETAPDGTKMLNGAKLAAVNTAAIGEIMRDLDALKAKRERGAKPRARGRQPASDSEDAPVTNLGYRLASPEQVLRDAYRPLPSKPIQQSHVFAPPNRFDQLDAIQGVPEEKLPESDPHRGFLRAAATSALDTAALPVTLVGKGVEALGYPNAAAHLDANEAMGGLEWLARKKEYGDYQREQRSDQRDWPGMVQAGEAVGSSIGGAPMGALTARLGPMAGTVMSTTKQALGPGAGSRSPKAKAAAQFLKEHPEAPVLRDYMKTGYDHVNTALRSEAGIGAKLPREMQGNALVKADRLKGLLEQAAESGHAQPGTVLRGIEVPAGTVDNWKAKGAVENRSFWSTTASPHVADEFSRMQNSRDLPEKVILKIKQKSAVPVGALNGGFEDELLIPPGKKFEIAGHSVDDYGNHVVELKQVDKFKPGVQPAFSFAEGRGPIGSDVSYSAPISRKDDR